MTSTSCRVILLNENDSISPDVKESYLATLPSGVSVSTFTSIDALVDYAAEELSRNRLVAFPSETVYGMGGNGLNAGAAKDIYAAKGRPASDPLILHVDGLEMALSLVQLSKSECVVYRALVGAFWPGPLTICAPAASHIPSEITGGKHAVSCRMPNSEPILSIIRKAQLPIAGPSANKFGRISPTRPEHVIRAFADDDVSVIDLGPERAQPCTVGIESTVLMLGETTEGVRLQILRRGAVTAAMLSEAVASLDVACHVCFLNPEVEDVFVGGADGRKIEGSAGLAPVSKQIEEAVKYYNDDSCDAAAPGTSITHYAPLVPCLLARMVEESEISTQPDMSDTECLFPALAEVVVLDLGLPGVERFTQRDAVAAVVGTDVENDQDLMSNVFALLHLAEEAAVKTGAKAIVVPIPLNLPDGSNQAVVAVCDRIYRAASGNICKLIYELDPKGFKRSKYLAI